MASHATFTSASAPLSTYGKDWITTYEAREKLWRRGTKATRQLHALERAADTVARSHGCRAGEWLWNHTLDVYDVPVYTEAWQPVDYGPMVWLKVNGVLATRAAEKDKAALHALAVYTQGACEKVWAEIREVYARPAPAHDPPAPWTAGGKFYAAFGHMP